jgi:hypothetical protein
MNVVKTILHNKIENDFLAYNLIVYIELKIVKNFNLYSILFVFQKSICYNFRHFIFVFLFNFVLVPTLRYRYINLNTFIKFEYTFYDTHNVV